MEWIGRKNKQRKHVRIQRLKALILFPSVLILTMILMIIIIIVIIFILIALTLRLIAVILSTQQIIDIGSCQSPDWSGWLLQIEWSNRALKSWLELPHCWCWRWHMRHVCHVCRLLLRQHRVPRHRVPCTAKKKKEKRKKRKRKKKKVRYWLLGYYYYFF